MAKSTVILRRYADIGEAEAFRGRLALEGIESFIHGTDNAAAFGMGGAPFASGIRLEVFPEDAERADRLLLQDQERLQQASDWECPRCSEPNEPAFEVCWSCQKKRPDNAMPARQHDESTESPSDSGHQESSILVEPTKTQNLASPNQGPYRPVLLDDASAPAKVPKAERSAASPADRETLQSEIRRLWLLCGVAIMALPLMLSLYAIYRIMKINVEVESTEGFQSQLKILFFVHLVILGASMLYLTSIFAGSIY